MQSDFNSVARTLQKGQRCKLIWYLTTGDYKARQRVEMLPHSTAPNVSVYFSRPISGAVEEGEGRDGGRTSRPECVLRPPRPAPVAPKRERVRGVHQRGLRLSGKAEHTCRVAQRGNGQKVLNETLFWPR